MLIAGIYGALHNQISFTVSAEYFTKFKYKQFDLIDSHLPDRLKVSIIGFLASWRMGAIVAIIIGDFGSLDRTWKEMYLCGLRAFVTALCITCVTGAIGLMYGWFFASHDASLCKRFCYPDEVENVRNFIAVGHLHNYGYMGGALGIVGGLIHQNLMKRQGKQEGDNSPV